MANIQTIDAGQAGWDKIFNANFEAVGNGNPTFTDTGWVKDGITLVNGAQVYSDFVGDTPSFRIVQMGTLNVLFITGSIKGIAATPGLAAKNIVIFPDVASKWLLAHQTVNPHFVTQSGGYRFGWAWNANSLNLELISDSVNSDAWIGFTQVFIA